MGLGKLDVEFLPLAFGSPPSLVGILSAGAFIEPFRLDKSSIGRRHVDAPREFLQFDVKWMVREKIGSVDLVLAVGIL